jgi:hypothetical protein
MAELKKGETKFYDRIEVAMIFWGGLLAVAVTGVPHFFTKLWEAIQWPIVAIKAIYGYY